MARSHLERIAKKYEVNFIAESLPGMLRITSRELWCVPGQRVKDVILFVQLINSVLATIFGAVENRIGRLSCPLADA